MSSLQRILYVSLILSAPSLALAQGDPGDDPIITGKKTGDAPPPQTPPPPAENRDSAPWSWPWGGAVRSPGWTQDENWANTHFWLMDVGHVQLEGIWQGTVQRRSYDVDQLFEAKARIGLLPHIELSIGEDATLLTHDHFRQYGNEIGARFSPFDYGTFPLNPAVEVYWMPRHNLPDAYQARGSLGGELFKGFFVVGNAVFEGETGGIHDYTWGFRGGVAYELLHDVLRVGCEGGVLWDWDRDHHTTPFRDTTPTVGPTALFRPLALVKPEWGNYAKLTVSAEFGIRDDNTNVPFMVGTAVFAFGF
ncbi:MAG TPA: hypothetical protein VFF73_24975 [Planctomycetota bacterium]|nr:hypothetical protein [Planctomycetota bacterium]